MSESRIAGADLTQERIRQLTEQVTQMAVRAREAGDEVNRITVEATSRDRSAVVTVGSGGVLRSIRPGSNAGSVGAAKLCASIMEAYGRAAREAAEQASAVMERLTGRDTRTMQAMRAAMPVDEDAER